MPILKMPVAGAIPPPSPDRSFSTKSLDKSHAPLLLSSLQRSPQPPQATTAEEGCLLLSPPGFHLGPTPLSWATDSGREVGRDFKDTFQGQRERSREGYGGPGSRQKNPHPSPYLPARAGAPRWTVTIWDGGQRPPSGPLCSRFPTERAGRQRTFPHLPRTKADPLGFHQEEAPEVEPTEGLCLGELLTLGRWGQGWGWSLAEVLPGIAGM